LQCEFFVDEAQNCENPSQSKQIKPGPCSLCADMCGYVRFLAEKGYEAPSVQPPTAQRSSKGQRSKMARLWDKMARNRFVDPEIKANQGKSSPAREIFFETCREKYELATASKEFKIFGGTHRRTVVHVAAAGLLPGAN
jgi:hypothetical protein